MKFSVFLYSLLSAFLFFYTKNVFCTILYHLILNSTNLIQTYFHVQFLSTPEFVLWLIWCIMFYFAITNRKLLKQIFTISSKDIYELKKIDFSKKISLILISLLSLIIIIASK